MIKHICNGDTHLNILSITERMGVELKETGVIIISFVLKFHREFTTITKQRSLIWELSYRSVKFHDCQWTSRCSYHQTRRIVNCATQVKINYLFLASRIINYRWFKFQWNRKGKNGGFLSNWVVCCLYEIGCQCDMLIWVFISY